MTLADELASAFEAESKSPIRDPHKVLVSRFPECWTNNEREKVSDTLNQYGILEDLVIEKDLFIHYAVASFSDPQDASNAISELHNVDVRVKESDEMIETTYDGLFVQHYSLAIQDMWREREKRVEEKMNVKPAALDKVMVVKVPPNFRDADFGHEPAAIYLLPQRWEHDKLRTAFLVFDNEADLQSNQAHLHSMGNACCRLASILPKYFGENARKAKRLRVIEQQMPPVPVPPTVGSPTAPDLPTVPDLPSTAPTSPMAEPGEATSSTAPAPGEPARGSVPKKLAKKAGFKETRQVYFLDELPMPHRPNLTQGEEPCCELFFKSDFLEPGTAYDDEWEDDVRDELESISFESLEMCRNVSDQRIGCGYLKFSTQALAEHTLQTLESSLFKLQWSESERFMLGVKGPYCCDVAGSIDIAAVTRESTCRIEVREEYPMRFLVRGVTNDHVALAKAALAQQLAQIHGRVRVLTIRMDNVPSSYPDRDVRMLFSNFSGVDTFTRTGSSVEVTLNKPEKNREAVRQLHKKLLDGFPVHCSLQPAEPKASNSHSAKSPLLSKARPSISPLPDNAAQKTASASAAPKAVPRGKAKPPVLNAGKVPPPPPPKKVPPKPPVVATSSSSTKKEETVKPASNTNSSKKKHSSDWEEILREAQVADQKKEYGKAAKLYAGAVNILMQLKKNTSDEGEKARLRKIQVTNLSRAETAKKKHEEQKKRPPPSSRRSSDSPRRERRKSRRRSRSRSRRSSRSRRTRRSRRR